MKKIEWRRDGARICPVARRGFPECFCFNISSKKAEAAITYCLGAYRNCSVLKQLIERGEVSLDEDDALFRESPPRFPSGGGSR